MALSLCKAIIYLSHISKLGTPLKTYLSIVVPEENVATLRHGATVIRGEMKASLLDGDSQNYDLDRGFTRHPIDDNHGQGIVIKLGKPCIINTVRMLLWDRDMRWVRCLTYFIACCSNRLVKKN